MHKTSHKMHMHDRLTIDTKVFEIVGREGRGVLDNNDLDIKIVVEVIHLYLFFSDCTQ